VTVARHDGGELAHGDPNGNAFWTVAF
jgi:hypothetical protein